MVRYTKEQYEDIINNSNIFNIDRERDYALYGEEETKFITLIYEYYLYYVSSSSATNFGLEFFNSAKESLKYFSHEKGKFLNYFNKVFKQKWHIEKAKQNINQFRGGIQIGTKQNKLLSQILKIVDNIDEITNEQIEKISNIFSIPKEEIEELIIINKNSACTSNIVNNGDEEIDLFDTCGVCDDIDQKLAIEEKLKEIDLAFDSLANRQNTRDIISSLLTIDVIKSVSSIMDITKQEYHFLNKEVINAYTTENKLYTNREIAKLYNVSEQSLTRTYSTFKKKLHNK